MTSINQTPQKSTYVNLCFSCGGEKDLRPYQSYRWGLWHICKACDIAGEKMRATRQQEAQKRRQFTLKDGDE